MASDTRTVAFIAEQAAGAGDVRSRAMFGEHALYCDGVLVALVCDDELFVKATAAGRGHAPGAAEAPPYPGARPCIVVESEQWDDAEWLGELFRVTAAALPPPKPKRRSKARG